MISRHLKRFSLSTPSIGTFRYTNEKILPSTFNLYDKVLQGDRYALSKAITLVESTRADHRVQASNLVSLLLAKLKSDQSNTNIFNTNTLKPAFRIGLSGAPGVGKSTFIETFGMMLVEQGHKVSVLAVDPSSSVSGGSILGDKTRMDQLSRSESAYVRPSPSSGTLGGVARNTGEAIILCEAAGYDIILVETVGVGQSETLVADIVDMFVLLVPPGGGDELQGIKKGIVELAELIIINKADGNLLIPAQTTQLEYVSALKLLKPRNEDWRPPVLKVSSVLNTGLDKAWKSMLDYYKLTMESGELERKRAQQRRKWMWRLVSDEILDRVKRDTGLDVLVKELETKVISGEIPPGKAADQILNSFLGIRKINLSKQD